MVEDRGTSAYLFARERAAQVTHRLSALEHDS